MIAVCTLKTLRYINSTKVIYLASYLYSKWLQFNAVILMLHQYVITLDTFYYYRCMFYLFTIAAFTDSFV